MTRNCPPVLLSFIHLSYYISSSPIMHKTKQNGPITFGNWQYPQTPSQPLSDYKAKLVKSTTTLHNTTQHFNYKEKTNNLVTVMLYTTTLWSMAVILQQQYSNSSAFPLFFSSLTNPLSSFGPTRFCHQHFLI